MRYNDLDRAFIFLRDRLALDAGLDLPINEVLNKGSNLLLSKLLRLIKRELLILDSLLDGKGRPLVDFEVKITSVGAEGFRVNDSKVNLAFMFLCDGFERLC